MKISMQTAGMWERFGTDKTYRMIKEAGFDGVDVNLDQLFNPTQVRQKQRPELFVKEDLGDLLEACKPFGEMGEKYGLENFQGHAIYPTCLPNDDEYNEFLMTVLEKMIICAASIGVGKLVVHPFHYGYIDRLPAEKEWDLNIKNYTRLCSIAKDNGVRICLENLFTRHPRGKIFTAPGSDIEKACRYVDTLNDIAGEKIFGFCLDTGHTLLLGLDIKETMLKLGDRIIAMHLHDNDGIEDRHLAPYMGILDWNRFVQGLSMISYNENIDFETLSIWNTIDNEVCGEVIKVIAKTGRIFAKRAGKEE